MEKTDKAKKTLVNLTQDFLRVLMAANGQELDLSQVEKTLDASKRRIYDVTNVLAGIGVIERTGKSKVRWVGNKVNVDDNAAYRDLLHHESELERLTKMVDDSLAELDSTQDFQSFAWVSEKDIMCLKGNSDISIFALRGPSDLSIQVPEEEGNIHRLICKSNQGTIDLIQVNSPQ
ncbi:transcription factor E2F [Histomonas meleagridis]|uniref:transcription factor E2F n=1 Tax=Histomonas meleagridis TaxID=135588 RepID=UPI00355A46B2|nr:transcription factor E2F [Histomonas meleagridis]KAH0807160.1 transcription factor E2F [Histomonas meleagridis]